MSDDAVMPEDPKTPLLLARLYEMVEDDTVFDLQRVDDPEQFKRQCREIFTHLYENTASNWNRMIQHPDDAKPEFPGVVLFRRFDILGSRWIDAFARSIRLVARRQDLPGQAHRDFLYFMLGGLFSGWQEHLRTAPKTKTPIYLVSSSDSRAPER
jgi:hypothetical protein